MTTPRIADTTRNERNTAELNFCNITILTPFLLGLFKQIYAGMGLAHLAIILAGIYRLLTVRDAEWRLIIIVVIVLDICLLVFLTPRVLKIIKQSERG